MVQIFPISTFEEFETFQSKFKYVILRFGASWCTTCVKIKQPINQWIGSLDSNLELDDVVLLDIDFESYDSEPKFVEFVSISKLPTFYCQDKFFIEGSDIDKIKSSILLLGSLGEDF